MKILKKGGSREKGQEETKSMPHEPVKLIPLTHMHDRSLL